MSSRLPRRQRRRLLLAALGFASTLWIASLAVNARRYGDHITIHFGEGFLGVYWGGDAEVRNGLIYNNFCPPWDGRGAGGELSEDTLWEVYGPTYCLSPGRMGHLWDYGAFRTRALGLWRPRLEANAVVVPFWLVCVVGLAAIGASWFRHRHHIPSGCCRNCRYDLTGNVSGRCPECGTTVPQAAGASYAFNDERPSAEHPRCHR
jgi:hypothetical protein